MYLLSTYFGPGTSIVLQLSTICWVSQTDKVTAVFRLGLGWRTWYSRDQTWKNIGAKITQTDHVKGFGFSSKSNGLKIDEIITKTKIITLWYFSWFYSINLKKWMVWNWRQVLEKTLTMNRKTKKPLILDLAFLPPILVYLKIASVILFESKCYCWNFPTSILNEKYHTKT